MVVSDSSTELNQLLETWDSDIGSGADPLPVLTRMAELMEKETEAYLKIDPDPFDNRHPGRTDPDCLLGQLLKFLFKNDNFINKLVNNYLMHRENRELNTVSARLLIDIMPGLETSAVFQETEGLVSRLYQWAEHASEPLRSYATGLLAAAMEIQDITGTYREQNSRLIPIMLQRLHELSREEMAASGSNIGMNVEETGDSSASGQNRPFAHLSAEQTPLNAKDEASKVKSKMQTSDKSYTSVPRITIPSPHPPFKTPPLPFHGESSSNSWAEMEPYVIGSYQMFPLTTKMQQRLILQYLTAMGEYQEMLGYVFEHNSMNLILHYISLKENKDVRLAFEALKYLAALLCHKKFAIEFVTVGGLQRLLEVHRPSIAATGVSICLYYLAYSEDALEKICLLQHYALSDLVRYTLWLLECSHESSRCHATMFFSLSFQFRAILELFDQQDGLRKLYNMISTLEILSIDETSTVDHLTDDEVFSSRQTARQVCLALRRYYEAHLAIKAEQLRRSNSRNLEHLSSPSSTTSSSSSSSSTSIPPYKAAKFPPEVMKRNIDTLFELLPLRSSWTPVDELHRLSGVTLLLQLIVMAYDWNYSGRAETVRSALEVLSICSVVPKTQLAFCETVPLVDTPNMVGMGILLKVAEGEILPDADVQKSALNVIINCVCSPTTRIGGYVGRVISGSAKKRVSIKNSEDLANKMWNCVRSNNGIMVLLSLLMVKTPITDADTIRALACKALVGLARSETVKQIISKLPLFTKGQLQVLMREPVLQDNRLEHVKFCRYARELIERVTGKPLATGVESSIARINKMDIVAQTKILYNEKQLLQLIQQYLQTKGLAESAAILQREALLPGSSGSVTGTPRTSSPILTSHTCAVSPVTSRLISRLNVGMPSPSTSLPSVFTSPLPPPLHVASTSGNRSVRMSPSLHSRTQLFQNQSAANSPGGKTAPSTPKSLASILQKSQMNCGNYQQSPILKRENFMVTNQRLGSYSSDMLPPSSPNTATLQTAVTLDGIVTEYLRQQHLLCDHPVILCPPFDLFVSEHNRVIGSDQNFFDSLHLNGVSYTILERPHRCHDPWFKNLAPTNMTARIQRQSIFPRFGGYDGARMNRKFIYSRFRPFRTYRDDEDNDCFTSCAFSAKDDYLIFGTSSGEIQTYNLESGEKEMSSRCHSSAVTHCEPSRDGKLLLTSSAWRSPLSALWSIGSAVEMKYPFDNDYHVEFSKSSQDRVVGTKEHSAIIYDISTGQELMTLKNNEMANNYIRNQATFNPSDDLVLSDGILWDVRGRNPIHKFDKFNANISGVFHPNGLEIVSNSEIWDIRTFHLLHTVPALDQCQIIFNHIGDVIYGAIIEEEEDSSTNEEQVKSPFGSSIRTFDATDYSNIATIDIKKNIFGLCTDKSDCYLAIIENQAAADYASESICRLYEVGRSKVDDDDDDDDDEEDDDDNDVDATDDDDDEDLDDSDDDEEEQDEDRNSSSDYYDVPTDEEEDEEEGEAEEEENMAVDGDEEEEEEGDDDEEEGDDDDDDDDDILFSLNDGSRSSLQ